MTLDNLTSSTEFPPKEPPRPSVVARVRKVYDKFVEMHGQSMMSITLSRKNYDEYVREVEHIDRLVLERIRDYQLHGVRVNWDIDELEDECVCHRNNGEWHVLPF